MDISGDLMGKAESFSKLVMKFSRYILLAYIVVGLALIPFSQKILQEMTTREEVFLPKGVESIEADNIVESEFGTNTTPDIIIVFHSKDNSSLLNEGIYLLSQDIMNWMYFDWYDENGSVAIYVMDFFTSTDSLLKATILMYRMPILMTNMTISILWGLSYAFGSAWESTYTSTTNISLADQIANETMYNQCDQLYQEIVDTYGYMLMGYISTEDLRSLMFGYVQTFTQIWMFRRNNETLNATLPPNSNIDYAITNITRSATSVVAASALEPNMGEFINTIAQSFNYTTWNDANAVYQFALGYLSGIYNLNLSNPYEIQFINDIYYGRLPYNDTLYMAYYWNIIHEMKAPGGFPINVYLFFRGMLVSSDNDTLLMIVSVRPDIRNMSDYDIEPYLSELRGYLDSKENDKIEIITTGILPFRVDNTVNAEKDIRRIDIITFSLTLILLFIIYRGVPVAMMPLLLMGLTIIIARAVLLILSMAIGLYISDITIALMSTVVIGAGVDYTIFLISRYAEDRKRGKSKEEAIVSVVKHAGKSVLLSGGTVMIAFGSLMLSSFKFLGHVGLGIMTGVGITLLVALTLTPSVLAIFGDKIFWPSRLTTTEEDESAEAEYKEGRYEKALRRLSEWTIKHSGVIIIMAMLVTVPAIYAYYHFGTTYDFMKLTREGTSSRTGFDIMQSEIGSEVFATTDIVAIYEDISFIKPDGTIDVELVRLYIKPITEKLESIEGVKYVCSPYKPLGVPIPESENVTTLEDQITLATARGFISRNGSIVKFVAYIEPAPYTREAFDIVEKIRSELKKISEESDTNVTFLVGGLSASYKDISDIVNNDFRFLTVIVVAGIIALLFIALRSILIPIRLEITILMSIIWAIALSMLIWDVFASLQLVWFIPLFMFTVLNGLGMDYDIFLMTRIEEERFEKGLSDKQAIVEAVVSTGKIISIAGIIMAAAFGSLLLTLSPPTRQIGLTLMLGVLIDAFIIRIILVPAIMMIAGKWNWWPRKR